MPPKGGGIEAQGLDFVLGVVDDATPGLKKFDAAVDSSAVHAERAGERVASAQKAAARAARRSYDDMSDDMDEWTGKGGRAVRKVIESFDDFGKTTGVTLGRIAAKLKEFGGNTNKAIEVFHKLAGLTPFDSKGLEKQITALDQVLGGYFKKTGKENEKFTNAFLKQNDRVIREAIKDWEQFGKTAPAELKKAEAALDSFEKKNKFMRIEDLAGRIKGLSVKNTVLGAAAVGLISKGQEYAEEGFTAANPAAKTEMGGEKMVQGRRKDITTLAQTTGASFDELKDINKEFSQMAYLGPKSFKDTAEAALQLSRTTTMSVGDAAKLTDTLQQRFGMTKDQIKETEESIALLSKTSGASADAIGEIYDELKFLKFGMEGNAEAAGRLAKNTATAAAEMSKYGLDSKTAIQDVKSVMHGGMSEYQQNMKTMILGGMTSEEATKTLDDVANGVAGAAEKMEKTKGKAAGWARNLGGKGALGRAMGNEVGSKALKMDSEEMDKRAAYARGDIKTPELTAEQKKTANEEVLSGGQRRERTENRGKGLGAQLSGQTYDVARSLAEVVDKQAEGLAKFSEASPLFSAAVSIFGTAANVFAAAVAVRSGIETAQALGVPGAGKLASGVGKVGGLVGKAAPAVLAGGKAVTAGAVGAAAVVYGGAAALGVIANRRIKTKADDLDAQASLDSSKKSATDLNVMKKKIEEAHNAGDWDKEYRARAAFQKLFGGQGAAVMPPKPEPGTATPMTVTPLRSSASAESSASPTAATAAGAAPAGAPQNGPAEQEKPTGGAYSKDLGGLVSLAEAQKFRVTSTTGDAHNKGSLHYQGKAVDVSVKGKSSSDIGAFKMAASASGFKVRDEQTKPAGQAVWSAPHLHMEIPGGATATASMAKKPSASPAGPSSTAVASPTGPSATADTSGASASVQGKGMTEAASAPAVAAASQEPFTGSTDGDKSVISELRKTNSILARIAATSSRPGDIRRPPNPAMTEMNQGGMG